MIPKNEATEKELLIFKSIVYLLLLVAPVVYVLIAYFVAQPGGEPLSPSDAGQAKIMFNVLLIIAVVAPLLYPMIEKFQIRNYKGVELLPSVRVNLYQSVTLIKISLIESCFIYGLAMVYITMDMSYLTYFYPIGIIWSIIYWPKESKYLEFKRKLETV